MSILNVDEIRDNSGSTTIAPSIPGLENRMASAWVNFNASANPITIRDSHNVSSITDHGVGDYSANFASSLNNTDYVASISGNVEASNIPILSVQTQTTALVRVSSTGWSGGSTENSRPADRARISVIVFGG